MAAKLWLGLVIDDLAGSPFMASLCPRRFPPSFRGFMKNKILAFRLRRFSDSYEIPASNRHASIRGQNQKEGEGPNQPVFQVRNPRHNLSPQSELWTTV